MHTHSQEDKNKLQHSTFIKGIRKLLCDCRCTNRIQKYKFMWNAASEKNVLEKLRSSSHCPNIVGFYFFLFGLSFFWKPTPGKSLGRLCWVSLVSQDIFNLKRPSFKQFSSLGLWRFNSKCKSPRRLWNDMSGMWPETLNIRNESKLIRIEILCPQTWAPARNETRKRRETKE